MLAPVFLALLLAAGVSACSELDPQTTPDPGPDVARPGGAQVTVQVASVGVDLASGEPLALLHSDWEALLPIWIGEIEAVAIARALQGVEVPRPMTHDLLVDVVAALGGTIEELEVAAIREATYLGILRIRTADGVREVDTRPSDGLALAVRTGARIRVARPLLEGAPDVDFLSSEGGAPIVRIRGITAGSPRDGDAARFDLPDRDGVVVLHVTSAIEARGLRRGDLVVRAAGAEVRNPSDLLEALTRTGSGGVEIVRLRDGTEETIQVPPRRGPGRVGD